MEQRPDPEPSPLSTHVVADPQTPSMVRAVAVDVDSGNSGNTVGYGPIVPSLSADAGRDYREGHITADVPEALTQRHAKLYDDALDVVEGLLSGPDLPRGSQTKLAAATAVLDRMWPRKAHQSSATLSITANAIAILVGQPQTVPPSTPASTPATLPQPLPPTV